MQDHLAGGFQSKCGVHPSIGPAERAAEDLALLKSEGRSAAIAFEEAPDLRRSRLSLHPESRTRPGQRIEALEKRFFRREAQEENVWWLISTEPRSERSLVHVKVIDFDRGLRWNDRFCVNSDASKVFATRDGNSQEVVSVRDRTDITLRPHRRAVRGHGYRSLARTKVGEKLGGTCPAHVEYR